MSSKELKCYSHKQQKFCEWKYHCFKCGTAQLLWAGHTAGSSVRMSSSWEQHTLQVQVWGWAVPGSCTCCRLTSQFRFPLPLPAEDRSITSVEIGILQSSSSGANALFRREPLHHYSGIVEGENRASFWICMPRRNINKRHELVHMKFPWKQDCLLLQLFQWASFSSAE